MRPLFAIAPLALLLAAFGPHQRASVVENGERDTPSATPSSGKPSAGAPTTLARPAGQAPSAANVSLIQAQAPTQALAQR